MSEELLKQIDWSELSVNFSKHVHCNADNVPHDIGLKLLEITLEFMQKHDMCEESKADRLEKELSDLREKVREFRNVLEKDWENLQQYTVEEIMDDVLFEIFNQIFGEDAK